VFDGRIILPDSTPNPSFLDEPEVNNEIDRILAIEDATEAATAWGELDELIVEKHYPAVIRYTYGSAFIHGSRVGNMLNDSTKGMPAFEVMYVIPE
jgi:peptide/nickel transport system substrate-binding protein